MVFSMSHADNSDFDEFIISRGVPQRISFDMTALLPKEKETVIKYLRKYESNSQIELYVEGIDANKKDFSLLLNFLARSGDLIFAIPKRYRRLKIINICLSDSCFRAIKGGILAKTISARVIGVRGANTYGRTLGDIKNWVSKNIPSTREEVFLRLYFKGKYKGEIHYLIGLFAASSEQKKEEKKSFLKSITDIITLPIKVVAYIGGTIAKLFAQQAEEGIILVKVEKASFQFKKNYISVGHEENALFKPEFVIAEIVEKSKVSSSRLFT